MQPVNGFSRRQLLTLLIAVPAIAGLLVVAGSAVADPTIDSKRAEAQQAMDQINQMDIELEQVVERYNSASLRLNQTTKDLNSARTTLKIARRSLGVARHALARRVIDVYMEQDEDADSTVAILFQATSLQDMIDRVEARQRISDHDARVVKQVKIFGDKVAVQEKHLEKLQAREQALVTRIASEKSSIERKIAERKAYVRRVRHEIAGLVAEQERQAREAAEAAQRRISSWSNTPPPPRGSVPSSAVGTEVVRYAMSRLGAPYVWAAAGPDTFDCSGLVVWSFAQVNISLPHSSYDLMHMGVPVSYSDLEPGDLVFFYGGGHVGIYIGGGQFIHAPHTGTVVQISTLAGYGGGLTAAVRIGT
jgi:cell wall-associated NlpC family hydrolase